MARVHAMVFWLDGLVGAGLLAACGGGMQADGPGAPPAACGAGVCVSTVAGSGQFGLADGPVMAARFFLPHAVAFDAMARLHVADFGSTSGTRLVADGQVSTLPEDTTEFPHPDDTASDGAGITYVADRYGNRIMKVTADGQESVLAGTGQAGDDDGDGASATFSMPSGLAFGADGALYVADMGNRKIRRITLAGGRAN